MLENVSLLPTGLLLLEDEVPYTLGGRPRFIVDRIGPGQPRVVPTRSAPTPAAATSSARCGCGWPTRSGWCELTRSFTAVDLLTVVPPVHPLPPVRLGGDWRQRREP